jgi:inosine triphosphate pyrophosphatase
MELPTLRVAYATGNAGKFAEAKHVFNRSENVARATVILQQFDVDTVEIQGSKVDISKHKLKEAAASLIERGELCEGDCDFDYLLVEDVSLDLDALNGFPGPYCKPMLEAIGPDGLWGVMSRYKDRNATVTCTVGAMSLKPGKFTETNVFAGSIRGTMVPPRGDVKHGKASWNSVFQPDGFAKTFGELQFVEQAEISHRRIALEKFLEDAIEAATEVEN